MGKQIRETYYFDKPGPQNTQDVIEIVKERAESTGIKEVVVASITGETALSFAKVLVGKTNVICVSGAPYRREWKLEWPCIKPEYGKELEKLGVPIVERAPYVFRSSVLEGSRWAAIFPELLVREILYCFSQGLKVAVEVVLMAVASGWVEPYQDAIGVGGTARGADTAAVIKATYPAMMFSKDAKKRLEIRQIIAIPNSRTSE